MHDTKERLSLFWIFALLNYLYADVLALFDIVGSPNLADAPHLPPWALPASAVLMENTHCHDRGVSTASV
jgi:hypothetical protein